MANLVMASLSSPLHGAIAHRQLDGVEIRMPVEWPDHRGLHGVATGLRGNRKVLRL